MAAAAAASRAGHARSCRSPRLILRIDRVPATAYIATMAMRDILILPDKRLRQVSDPVKKIDASLRKLIEDMVEANGLFATCLQHEIDHLNGVLFIDHLSKLKRDRVLKKFTKAAKRAAV